MTRREIYGRKLTVEETPALVEELIGLVGHLEATIRVYRDILIKRGIASGTEIEEAVSLQEAEATAAAERKLGVQSDDTE